MRIDKRFHAAPVALAALLILLPGTSHAEPKADLLAQCAACHGPNGNSQNPELPSIAGQPRVFIENQLVMIREGLRDVPPMKPVMANVDDAAVVELAKFFSSQKPAAKAGQVRQASYRAGEELSQKNLCGTCHLADYSGQNQVPRIAGQQEPFLLGTMKQFRDNPGPGRDTIMAATLRGMSDADLANLAHYLANYKP